MYPLKQSTIITIPIFVHDVSGDAVTGLVDGGFTKRISKNGGAFAAMTVTITEMENGFYSVPISAAHSDTLGILTVLFTHGSSKQINLQFRVDARLPDDMAYPTTTGRSIDVTATGAVGIDWANVENPATAVDLSGTDIQLADTVTTLTGNTAQTGDNFARLGAPAGASMSADIAAVKADTAVIGAAGAGLTAVGLGTDAIDADAVSTAGAQEIADALLDRDMSTGTDSGSTTVRTVRQALRYLRNKVAIVGTTMTVNKEDDTTASWTAVVATDAAADPITSIDPAGP